MTETIHPIYPVSPGSLLADELEVRGIGPAEFAAHAGMPLDAVMDLLDGTLPLTRPLAESLQAALAIDASFWLRVEHEYRRQLDALDQQPDAYREEIRRAIGPADVPAPPGALLAEELAVRGITPIDAAPRLGLPVDALMLLFDGQTALTPPVADAIEAYLGTPATIWLGLEHEYRAACDAGQVRAATG